MLLPISRTKKKKVTLKNMKKISNGAVDMILFQGLYLLYVET